MLPPAGVLTQPGDDRLPAVGASASASPASLDKEAMAPSVFAIKLTRWGSRGQGDLSYSEDPDTGLFTITGVVPGATLDRHLMTEAADAEVYAIDASDVDPRALGTLTVVMARGNKVPTDHDNVGSVWSERSGIRLENDDGAWVGTASTQVLGVGVTVGWATWELAGEGDYQGLTMFLHGDGRLHGGPWHAPDVLVGVIVPSGIVPAFPPPADIEGE